jgi:L-asparaginase
MPGLEIETGQVAQIDSKDMGQAVWRPLIKSVLHHLSRPEVRGVVITHGTDTLEETAFLLSGVLPRTKPVVLTGAMRAANAADADGPRNLADAVTLAAHGSLPGVSVVFAGQVFAGSQVQKLHAFDLDAFGALPHAALGRVTRSGYEGGKDLPALAGDWPSAERLLQTPHWPRVEVLLSHADAGPWLLNALLQAPKNAPVLRGLVLAGTGAGTLPAAWDEALTELMASGVEVWVCTRCAQSRLPLEVNARYTSVPWTPAQARVGLMLSLLT